MKPTKQDLVSIIIPTFNRSALLRAALESVFQQTYRDFEVIVVDDGSTDDTAVFLRSLAEQGLLQYIHQKNQGGSSARNRGIAESCGEFIAFLDSDDLFAPNKLEIQVQYLRGHPDVGLVHSGFTKMDDYGNDLGYRDTAWFSGHIYPRMLLYWTTLMATDTVVIPNRVIREIGLFDENLQMGEDLDLWRRIARKYPFGYINQSLAKVRVHQSNLSRDKLRATDEFIKYLGKAFKDDDNLSPLFKKRALSGMFSNAAYNLLSESGEEYLRFARINAGRSILNNPLNLHGYAALFASFLDHTLRNKIVISWRTARSWLMSRNRFH